MSSAKWRLVRNSPPIFTPLFSQFNFLNMLSNVAVNSLGEMVSPILGGPCLTPLLMLIFLFSLSRCTVTYGVPFSHLFTELQISAILNCTYLQFKSLKFGYADDWTLATQSNIFSHLESTLSRDIGHLNEYFDDWKLRLNAKKTVATCFHLDNKQAARKLKVTLAGEVLVHDFAPKYLGVTLDRSLTYRKHTENVRDKVKSRCNIISKLAGTDWGAPAPVLRTSAIALVYSVA